MTRTDHIASATAADIDVMRHRANASFTTMHLMMYQGANDSDIMLARTRASMRGASPAEIQRSIARWE
jgi:hypothetical protein